MRISGAAVASAFVLALCGTAHAQTFKTGNWEGSAHWQKDGSFSHCTITSTYQSGITVLLTVDATLNWRIGFANRQWNLTPGSQISLNYWVDGAPSRYGTARVATEHLAILDLPADRGVFELFRKGNRLTAAVPNGPQMTFALTGTSAGLQMLLDCAEARGQYPRPANTLQPTPAPASRPAGTPDTTQARKIEALRIVANHIAPAGLSNFRLLGDAEKERLGVPGDAAWVAEGVIGALDVIPAIPDLTVERIATKMISDDGSNCKGDFLSGSTPDPKSSGTIRRVYATCRPPQGASINTFYTIFKKLDGGFLKMGVVSMGDAEPARAAEMQLRSVAFEGM